MTIRLPGLPAEITQTRTIIGQASTLNVLPVDRQSPHRGGNGRISARIQAQLCLSGAVP